MNKKRWDENRLNWASAAAPGVFDCPSSVVWLTALDCEIRWREKKHKNVFETKAHQQRMASDKKQSINLCLCLLSALSVFFLSHSGFVSFLLRIYLCLTFCLWLCLSVFPFVSFCDCSCRSFSVSHQSLLLSVCLSNCFLSLFVLLCLPRVFSLCLCSSLCTFFG